VTPLVQTGTHVHPLQHQQGDHHERTVVAVGHHHVARREGIQQAAQQRVLAGLFARIWGDGQVHHAGRGQREDHTGAGDGKAASLLLRSGLRIGLLIGRGVGHGEGEAVDQLGVASLPEPDRIGLRFHLFGDLDREIVQGGFGELGPRAAVVPGVGRGRRLPGEFLMGDNLGHRGLARGLFAVAEDLPQEGPQRENRGIDGGHAEEVLMPGEDRCDPLGGENLGERQARLRQEGGHYLPKTGAATNARRCDTGHEKALLDFTEHASQGGLVKR